MITVEGQKVPLTIRKSPLAKRMSLRVDPKSEGVVVVIPRRGSERDAERFAVSHGAWILKHLATLPKRIAFADGTIIPLLGEPHEIKHAPQAARGVWVT